MLVARNLTVWLWLAVLIAGPAPAWLHDELCHRPQDAKLGHDHSGCSHAGNNAERSCEGAQESVAGCRSSDSCLTATAESRQSQHLNSGNVLKLVASHGDHDCLGCYLSGQISAPQLGQPSETFGPLADKVGSPRIFFVSFGLISEHLPRGPPVC